MDGDNRMDLYGFFSSVRSARIDKDAENKTVYPDDGVHTNVVPRRSLGSYLQFPYREITIDGQLYYKHIWDGHLIMVQD